MKDACYAAWNHDPGQCAASAAALVALAAQVQHPKVHALAAWAQGIAALADGRMDDALGHLALANAGWVQLGLPGLAAETQVPKLVALATLGRYDEAELCGLAACDTFLHTGNGLAAGKIELNLGHMRMQRDQYADAERLFRSALARFDTVQDVEHTALAHMALADALTWQRKFEHAARLYVQTIATAHTACLNAMEANAALNLGVLEQLRGQHDQALHWLESARRIFARLGAAQQTALADERLASVYLDVGLAEQALAAYDLAVPAYAGSGMRYEQAWALADRGRALLKLGRADQAGQSLQQAHALFSEEGNAPCAAMTDVLLAELASSQHDHAAALRLAQRAAQALAHANTPSWLLLAQWLYGESLRALDDAGAGAVLQGVLRDASAESAPEVLLRCHISLGRLHAATDDVTRAQDHFLQAVALIERQRQMLPSEEFRTAFLSDRLIPYTQLAVLARRGGDAAAALGWAERARARALQDMLHGGLVFSTARHQPRDAAETALLSDLDALRVELNWCYSQLNERNDLAASTRDALTRLAKSHEAEVQALTLRLQHRQPEHGSQIGATPGLDLERLQAHLADDTALVAYFADDEAYFAFVVTREGVVSVPHLAPMQQLNALVSRLRFQLEAMRHGSARVAAHMPQLIRRAQHYLQQLYAALLQPVLPLVGRRRLVLVPHRALHYVPFAALHNGQAYVGEAREVCIAPSVAALLHCLVLPEVAVSRAVLLGVTDARAPRVRDEVHALAGLFSEPTVLLDAQATLPALRQHAASADVLHLACHGMFRPESPFFSALRLADGWMTVRDCYALALRCSLVTLSACETGISAIAPGDELIGLARGFISAGTPSLLVSQWVVDDAATAELMQLFYAALLAGQRPAAALQHAQNVLRRTRPHPFFWAAFTLIGRW